MKGADIAAGLAIAFVAGLIPLYALAYTLYVLISLPLRRQERARLFLDLVETGIIRGQSIERTVCAISKTRDPSVGVRFHLLAAYLESGWNLTAALSKVGGLLTPQLVAMFKVGEEIGDVRKILPACRTVTRDATSHIQSAYNYFVVLAFVLIPAIPALFWLMTIFVIPKYQQLFADLLEGQSLPYVPFQAAAVLAQMQLVVALLFYVGAIFYLGGPRFRAWLGAGVFIPQLDALIYAVPWRRKRIHRDFGAMLAVLLDAEVPEAKAVLLAAESTGNIAFLRRAEQVAGQLCHGAGLVDAVAAMDSRGEFKWRLANATHAHGHFREALAGWLDSLDAGAFRQQQVFGQLVTTGMVLYNGLMVGLLAIFIFHSLTLVIEEGVLW